jgi:hypothetical protein
VVLVPSRGHTALHRPAPSGARPCHGPPCHHSAQVDSDSFPSKIPARLRPFGLPAEHSPRAYSDPSVQSRHMTLTTATPPGPGYIPPARVHAPAGHTQSSESPNLRTQLAKGGVRSCYYDKTYVGTRLKLYVQLTLEHSCTERESHTTAPAVWHTVPSCRRTCWVQTHWHCTATCPHTCGLPYNIHIRATSEGANSEASFEWAAELNNI